MKSKDKRITIKKYIVCVKYTKNKNIDKIYDDVLEKRPKQNTNYTKT